MNPAFDDSTTPAWLRVAVAEQLGQRPSPGPQWLVLEQLPVLEVGANRLNIRQMQAAVHALRASSLDRVAPLVELLKQHATAESRDAFVRELTRLWIEANSPSAHRWALDALAYWGSDAAAVYLAGLIRAWPEQNLYRRATESLDLLRRMGSETALLELALLARNGKPRRLQQTATGLLVTVAHERGLSTDQLDDRTVPDLGLDGDGGRLLDYGPRQFRLVVDANLKPLLHDGKGALRASLPAANRADEPALVDRAKQQWKLLARQLRDILKARTARLEQAMVSGRLWSVAEFERYIVRHPVVGLLARRLLWATADHRGHPSGIFRVTEDRTYAQVDESPLMLESSALVRLVHPLHLDDPTRQAWQEALTDHEIIPPFAQLSRATRVLTPQERQGHVIERACGARVPSIVLVGMLDRLGWDRGESGGQPVYGVTQRHVKYFPSADLLAVLDYSPGVPTRGIFRDGEDQTLGGCYFVRGVHPRFGWTESAVMLAEVDPVLMSEVLVVVEALRGKAVTPG